MTLTARIYVTLKPSVLDAQGTTVQHALEQLGFRGVAGVRVGKYLELQLTAGTRAAATREVERMCRQLLANPVIETYRIEINRRKAESRRQKAAIR